MIKKHKIKLGLITVLSILIVVSGMLYGNLQAASTNPYDKQELTFEEVKVLYHKRINDLFNSKLKLLKQGDEGSGTTEIPTGDECSENNYSTFCLALAAADEYEKYEEALRKRREIVPVGDEEGLERLGIIAAGQALAIDNELERSKKTLDMALDTYNETLPAYRMHDRFEQLIETLTKYNKKLSELRKEVEKLPSKFVDATTAKCT
jgi:hypothetical protein